MRLDLLISLVCCLLAATVQGAYFFRKHRNHRHHTRLVAVALFLVIIIWSIYAVGYLLIISGRVIPTAITSTVFRYGLWFMSGATTILAISFWEYVGARDEIEAIRQHQNEQKEALDKLRYEVVQNASHELRTPLTVIIGLSELLLLGEMGQIANAKHLDAISLIYERGKSLSAIINMMVSLIQEPFFERVNLADVALYAVGQLQRRAEKRGTTIDYDYHLNGHVVYGDLNKLQMAVFALLSNAIKFSKQGDVVTVGIENDSEYVYLTVTDTGIGISEKHLRTVFEWFYQVDGSSTRKFEGIGLGLSVVQRAVLLHKGFIEIESEPDKGSTFRLVFPKYE